jgi:hypothetical protein
VSAGKDKSEFTLHYLPNRNTHYSTSLDTQTTLQSQDPHHTPTPYAIHAPHTTPHHTAFVPHTITSTSHAIHSDKTHHTIHYTTSILYTIYTTPSTQHVISPKALTPHTTPPTTHHTHPATSSYAQKYTQQHVNNSLNRKQTKLPLQQNKYTMAHSHTGREKLSITWDNMYESVSMLNKRSKNSKPKKYFQYDPSIINS